ncbi:MAG: hypothetical protein OQK98_11310 [Gammaproteobacteria bacterium]|nr:hypothetical protein [Gammaproteobacteria bacterium]
MKKISLWTKFLHIILSLVAIAASLYVFFEKKMIIGGRLVPGVVYEFQFPANLVMAASLFCLSLFVFLAMFDSKVTKKICEWLLITALVLFFSTLFI